MDLVKKHGPQWVMLSNHFNRSNVALILKYNDLQPDIERTKGILSNKKAHYFTEKDDIKLLTTIRFDFKNYEMKRFA